MDLSRLKRKKGSRKNRRRVGRGESSNWGKTAGKGHKGQKARSGGKVAPHFEGGQMPLTRRLPKFGFVSPNRVVYAAVNLEKLEVFDAGTVVDRELLLSKRILRKKGPFKILARGKLTKALTVKAPAFSKAAMEMITKIGGKVEEVR